MKPFADRIESMLCSLWNKALVAENKNYDPDVEIPSVRQAILKEVEGLLPEKRESWRCSCNEYDLCGCSVNDYNKALDEIRAKIREGL